MRKRKRRRWLPFSPEARLWVVQRGLCFYCGRRMGHADRTVDHFVPVSRGGDNHADNLVIAHQRCNEDKRDRLPTEEERQRAAVLHARVEAARFTWIDFQV